MVILIEAIKKQSLISMQILPSVDDGARLEIMNKPFIRKLVGRRIIIKIKKSGGYYGVNI